MEDYNTPEEEYAEMRKTIDQLHAELAAAREENRYKAILIEDQRKEIGRVRTNLERELNAARGLNTALQKEIADALRELAAARDDAANFLEQREQFKLRYQGKLLRAEEAEKEVARVQAVVDAARKVYTEDRIFTLNASFLGDALAALKEEDK